MTEAMNDIRRGQVFASACIGMMFFGVTMVVLGALLPKLTEALALSTTMQTAMAVCLSGGIFVGSLLFGPLCDSYGHKWLLVSGCALVTAGMAGLTFFTINALLIAAIVAIGIGGGILNGQTNALVADIYAGDRRSSGRLSLLGTFYGVGAMTVTLLVAVLSKVDFAVVTRWITLVMALLTCYPMLVRFPRPSNPQSFPIGRAVRMLADPMLLMMSLVLFFESGIEMSTNTWASSYLPKAAGVSEDTALLSLTVMVGALTVARLLLTGVLERFNPSAVLMCCFGCLAAGFVVMWTATGTVATMCAMALVGVGTAATFPVVLGRIGARYPGLTGTAFGIAITIALVGNTSLNAVTGLMVSGDDPSAFPPVMIVGVAIMAIAFAIASKFNHKTTNI